MPLPMPPNPPPRPLTSSRRLALLSGLALFGVFGAASVCSAESPWRRRTPSSPPPPYGFSLEDVSGSPLPSFRHAGRTYTLGEPGARYNIRVTNPTSERVEVVLTVDGRDAVSGQVGDYVSQRGYLIEPWGSMVVEGFRRNLDEVAAFRFTDRSQSYSALRGTPENVGVIGVAFFPEKRRPASILRRREPMYFDESPRPAPRAAATRGGDDGHSEKRAGSRAPAASNADGRSKDSRSAPAEAPHRRDETARRKRDAESRGSEASNIGTEYGESRGSSVIEIPFERRSPTHPAALLTQRYDDYEGLVARGIDLAPVGYAYRYDDEPLPFPRNRFAPAP